MNPTRRSATFTASLASPFDEVWSFLANPENLHLWTVGFTQSAPTAAGDGYKVETARGPLDLFVRCSREYGVIDFHFGRDGHLATSPTRLLENGDGCVFIFTLFEPENPAAGQFETLVENVRAEMDLLRERFGASG